MIKSDFATWIVLYVVYGESELPFDTPLENSLATGQRDG